MKLDQISRTGMFAQTCSRPLSNVCVIWVCHTAPPCLLLGSISSPKKQKRKDIYTPSFQLPARETSAELERGDFNECPGPSFLCIGNDWRLNTQKKTKSPQKNDKKGFCSFS